MWVEYAAATPEARLPMRNRPTVVRNKRALQPHSIRLERPPLPRSRRPPTSPSPRRPTPPARPSPPPRPSPRRSPPPAPATEPAPAPVATPSAPLGPLPEPRRLLAVLLEPPGELEELCKRRSVPAQVSASSDRSPASPPLLRAAFARGRTHLPARLPSSFLNL